MFKVTARTILELGSELISSDIIAFYELIKNGFDARTTTGVEIHFRVPLRRSAYLSLLKMVRTGAAAVAEVRDAALDALNTDAPADQLKRARTTLGEARSRAELESAIEAVFASATIVISDTGFGMSQADLTENFLVIGTPCRKREVEKALQQGSAKAPFLGEKGIGRLSAMRLGERLRVETARSTDKRMNVLDIDWSAFADLDAMLDEIRVAPASGGSKPATDWSGTNILISRLTDDWNLERVRKMAEYEFARLTDPFRDQKDRPRIVLYWNEERIAIPWMPSALLANAHASVTGEYKTSKGKPRLEYSLRATNLGFKHPEVEERDVVTDADLMAALVGLSREVPDVALDGLGPFKFEMHWYNRRLLGRIDGIGEMKAVRKLQERWSGILLFRDGFRVFPYGEDHDDWLALDRKALRRSGYTLNKTQFIGRIEISRAANPALQDQTNREGLRETPEQQVFLDILQYVIQDRLFGFMKEIERQHKAEKVDLSEVKSEVAQLQARATNALKTLRKLAPAAGQQAVGDVEQALFEFAEFAERARQRIAQVEEESWQMVEMAGVGLMVEVVAHELARASENALENLQALQAKAVPEEVRAKLDSLQAEMKSLSKRVRILDPLSISGRQRTEVFSLNALVTSTLEAHSAQFKRHGIRVKFTEGEDPQVRVRAVRGMVVQILENLISNSKYWLQMRSTRSPGFRPVIEIDIHEHPPTIVFQDNGPGIAAEHREKVFQPFFSLKEKTKRRGLGLYIGRECAKAMGGALTLDDYADSDTKRLRRFSFELPEGALVR
jgi:signal transduction histidine kinase